MSFSINSIFGRLKKIQEKKKVIRAKAETIRLEKLAKEGKRRISQVIIVIITTIMYVSVPLDAILDQNAAGPKDIFDTGEDEDLLFK